MDPSARFHRSRDLALTLAIPVADLSFFSDILTPRCAWWQRLLEAAWVILGYYALRRRSSSPVLSFAIGWFYSASAALLTLLGVFSFTPFFVLLILLFTVANERPIRVSWLALAATAVPSGLAIWSIVQGQDDPSYRLSAFVASTVFYLIASAETWATGRRSRSARKSHERQRRRLAMADEAIREERLRVARELHDILAHTVTVMVLQASGARRVLASDPKIADDALSHIEDVGKTAMGELRRMLALIRSPARDRDEPSQSGLTDVGRLLDEALKAGVAARLEMHGPPAAIPMSVDRTIYRVVQEAITNIVKHAGPGTTAIVRLTWTTGLLIEITDDGGGAPVMEASALSTGQGLLGLAERVAVFGGTLTAGPHDNGFRVRASLPPQALISHPPSQYPGNEAVT
jgi:signal transduction histidine kinase